MPWLFVHIMKTAGTSFRTYMNQVAPGRIFPDDADLGPTAGQYIGPNRFVEHLEDGKVNPGRTDYMFGHFPLWITEDVPEHWNIATVIRDPIARTVSMIRHHRERRNLKHLSYEDILSDDNFRAKLIENYQTKVLGAERRDLASANDAMPSDGTTLQRAKKRLLSVAFLGITENIDESVAAWHRVTALPREVAFPHLNKAKPEPIPRDLRQAILPYVELDMELYEWAVKQNFLLK